MVTPASEIGSNPCFSAPTTYVSGARVRKRNAPDGSLVVVAVYDGEMALTLTPPTPAEPPASTIRPVSTPVVPARAGAEEDDQSEPAAKSATSPIRIERIYGRSPSEGRLLAASGQLEASRASRISAARPAFVR